MQWKIGEQVRSYPIKIANEILDFIIRVIFDEKKDDFLFWLYFGKLAKNSILVTGVVCKDCSWIQKKSYDILKKMRWNLIFSVFLK